MRYINVRYILLTYLQKTLICGCVKILRAIIGLCVKYTKQTKNVIYTMH